LRVLENKGGVSMETWYTAETFAEFMSDTVNNITYFCRQAVHKPEYKGKIIKLGRKWRISSKVLDEGGICV
jgi:hypothetical protein